MLAMYSGLEWEAQESSAGGRDAGGVAQTKVPPRGTWGIYFWLSSGRRGWVWHTGHSHYLLMMLGIYAALEFALAHLPGMFSPLVSLHA
jgi:L-ascorbate metabolism protein UlaG (beta-lactamase superfamily)